MNTLFLSSQLKNMPWVYNDIVVDVGSETLTVAQLIQRYNDLKAALQDVEKMTKKPRAKKPTTKTEK